MPFITFIYRIAHNKQIFYGKYICESISDDHEGLDSEIEPTLIDGINDYRKQKGLAKLNKKVFIGVLSCSISEYIPTYSSAAEIKCFDFYHIKNILKKDETYVNGKQIT
jgi:hypothetical protein